MITILEQYFNFNKRKRISRPKTLLFFGLFFLSIPIWNYFSVAYYNQVPITAVKLVFKNFQVIEILILISSLIVGIGLLLVKRWGWYSFLVYAALFILYNLYTLISNPILYNIGAFVQTLLGFLAITYFLRKDISAPYFKLYPRGWRGEIRYPIQIAVKVNSDTRTTRDFSETGFYVDWQNCDLNLNQEVQIEISKDKDIIHLVGGIVRIDENGVGIAFRKITKLQNEFILGLIGETN